MTKTTKVNKHVARRQSDRQQRAAVDAIDKHVCDTGDWTSEQGMDALDKIRKDNPYAQADFQVQTDAGGLTTEARRRSGTEPFGYIAGPNAKHPLDTDMPEDLDLDALFGDIAA